MSLDMRVMHVKPNGVSRVWDVKLLDQRQNARIHLNPEGTEFMDLVIISGEHYHPENVKPKHDHQEIAKARRKRHAKKKRQKARNAP